MIINEEKVKALYLSHPMSTDYDVELKEFPELYREKKLSLGESFIFKGNKYQIVGVVFDFDEKIRVFELEKEEKQW